MRNIFFMIACCCLGFSSVRAQSAAAAGDAVTSLIKLPVIYLRKAFSVHLVCNEKINYRNVSLAGVAIDQPMDGVIRLSVGDSIATANEQGVVTLFGEKRFCQYRVIVNSSLPDSLYRSSITVVESDWREVPGDERYLSPVELRASAFALMKSNKGSRQVRRNQYGLKARLNGVSSCGDYLFIDLSYSNENNIIYDIDQLLFSLEDKKIVKSTNSQSVQMIPELSLFKLDRFNKNYRNVFVFRKFTFPGDKVLRVSLSEKQVSGRAISFDVQYRDILNADELIY